MTWEIVRSGNTEFAIDFDVIHRILRSYYTAVLQYEYAREVTLSDSTWYNPLSWSLPDVTNIEVDWEKVYRHADQDAEETVLSMRREASINASKLGYQLRWMIDETARYKEMFVDWMGRVQTQNMRNIEKSVDDYQSHIEAAKVVRDVSAEGLMVGATVMSGGAALGVLSAGSVLKGTAKFQDTDSVGAAVMEGAGSFFFAYIKLGKKFTFKQDLYLAIAQAPWKAGTELVGGASFAYSALTGSLKLTSPFVEGLFKIAPAKTLFDRVAVPLVLTFGGENVTSAFLSKYVGKAIQSVLIEKKGRNAIYEEMTATAVPPRPKAKQDAKKSIIQDATISSKWLLNIAYVNMNRGIGNGW